jgi:chitodextrinase
MRTEPGPTVPMQAVASALPGADRTVPATPAGLRVTSRSLNAVSLDWASSVDNVEVAGYIVYRDGRPVGTTYNPSFTDDGLSPQTRYTYTVAAFDAAGNVSTTSGPVSAITLAAPDVSPPSVPTGLAVTGRSITALVLAWGTSQDNVGVAGYEVYRDGALIANVPQPGYTDNGLAPASTHTYKVRAYDTSNNASADSGPTSATTLQAPDNAPPSPPNGLGAVATGPTTIDLSWQASHDNVGVAKYQVFRGGVKVADVAATAYTDQGLTPDTTYTYAVRAVDAAGNTSGPSQTASAHTASPPPPPPSPSPSPTPGPTTNPQPEIMSVALTATPPPACKLALQATATA